MDICQEFIVFILRSCTLYLNFLTVSSVHDRIIMMSCPGEREKHDPGAKIAGQITVGPLPLHPHAPLSPPARGKGQPIEKAQH